MLDRSCRGFAAVSLLFIGWLSQACTGGLDERPHADGDGDVDGDVDGDCVDRGCPAGSVCVDGRCQAEDDRCRDVVCEVPGARCVYGVCILDEECASVVCGAGEVCVQGECVPDDACAGVSCPPGEFCVGGACTTEDPCAAVTCDPGQLCRAGACVPDDPCWGVTCPALGEVCRGGDCVLADSCAGVVCDQPGEVCSGGVCVPGALDADADGFTAALDCNDADPTINPGAVEACDGVDNDCDGAVDEGFDADGDGVTSCGGGVPALADCDDGDAAIHPGAAETCDGVDEDCSGVVDDGIATRACTGVCGAGTERCSGGAWVCDAPAGQCLPGDIGSEPCGTRCGTRYRNCLANCTWGGWGACEDEGVCDAGATETMPCGNCGERTRTCSTTTCTWSDWGSCRGEGPCAPGTATNAGCPGPCMLGICTADCRAPSRCAMCDLACGNGFWQCGYGECPSGYHIWERGCSTSCPGAMCSSGVDNVVWCEETCREGTQRCGSTCPPGYVVDSYYCTTDCGAWPSCLSSPMNNTVWCVLP